MISLQPAEDPEGEYFQSVYLVRVAREEDRRIPMPVVRPMILPPIEQTVLGVRRPAEIDLEVL
jgi:hypothetical protein